MLKRAWMLVAVLWAACELGAQLASGRPVSGKIWGIALAPLALWFVLGGAGRFIVTGSFTKPKCRLYRP
jgi:hypothetical protein